MELSSLKEPQPDDLYARVPIYVIGQRDAHIVLSTTNTPNREKDFIYEIRKSMRQIIIQFRLMFVKFEKWFFSGTINISVGWLW